MDASRKHTVLLVAEAVTLAHFGRIVSLAKALDPTKYNIVVASDPRYLALEQPFPFTFHPIHSIPSADFTRALSQGKAAYNVRTLSQYVEEDLALLDRVKPDLVVGDFRLSLAVSAPLQAVPYATVVNAYWSPFADISYPVPDLPITKLFGVNLAQRLFDRVRPLAFALHARPLNKLRRRYGLTPLGHDLRQTYTWADFTLYADIPEAVPLVGLPPNHLHLGPVLWSAKAPLPEWWDDLPGDKPVAFITLGSSGQVDRLPQTLQALEKLPLTIMAATAGRIQLVEQPSNLFITDFLPIDIATGCADLVISNGGNLTTYQALTAGVPLIGLATNMDQLLNMQAVERLGTGMLLRGGKAESIDICATVTTVLEDPSYTKAARRIAEILSQYESSQRFREIVAKILQ